MKSSEKSTVKDQGRAIARGIVEENARKERNAAIAVKRKESTLRNAAEKLLFRNY